MTAQPATATTGTYHEPSTFLASVSREVASPGVFEVRP